MYRDSVVGVLHDIDLETDTTGKGKTCESYDYETPRTEQAMAALPSSWKSLKLQNGPDSNAEKWLHPQSHVHQTPECDSLLRHQLDQFVPGKYTTDYNDYGVSVYVCASYASCLTTVRFCQTMANWLIQLGHPWLMPSSLGTWICLNSILSLKIADTQSLSLIEPARCCILVYTETQEFMFHAHKVATCCGCAARAQGRLPGKIGTTKPTDQLLHLYY